MNIHLIKANPALYNSRGTLIESLFQTCLEQLASHQITQTDLASADWGIAEEIQQLKQADLIIYLFPLWWFGVPSELKHYFDQVLQYEETFAQSPVYGEGGRLTNKQFMLVVTTNLAKSDLGNAPILKNYQHVDDILTQIITTNHYVGIRQQLTTFHADNVVKGDTDWIEPAFQQHLAKQELTSQNTVSYMV